MQMFVKKYSSLILLTLISLIILFCFCACNVSSASVDYKSIVQNIDYGDECYVIGHKSPDTDTVCSAIAYANLKQKLGINCKPAISGKINNETKYVLDSFEVDAPDILEDASDKNIILVDHSSYEQAISGMDKANILEMLDHHNLGGVESINPLLIKDMPVGSTGTIVYTSYKEYGIDIDKTTAGMIASAILSDTQYLTLEITTDFDKKVLAELVKIAEIKDVEKYYENMLQESLNYQGMDDVSIIFSDYKEYDMSGAKVGIAYINTSDQATTEDMKNRMSVAIKDAYKTKRVQHLYVIINNANDNNALMLFYGDGVESIIKKAFPDSTNEQVKFNNSVSRKKDVVPKLEAAYKK